MKYTSNSFLLSATDLSNHLGCKHLTELDRSVALGERAKPDWNDPALAILQKRGQQHEDAYLLSLKSQGLSIAELNGQSVDNTVEAMKQGFDVITQATLQDGLWTGRADFLRKVNGKSALGAWSYEVEDTKLAQNTKAGTVLQLCLYTDIVGTIQGKPPEKMYVVKPGVDFPKDEFLFTDFRAYYHLIKQQLETTIANQPLSTYPNPVPHCDICRWWKECDKRRHDDDHLSLIAGIHTLHRTELERQGIDTLEQYANENAPLREKPERGNEATYATIQEQARIQLKGRDKDKPIYELFPSEEGRGLNRLPKPSPGDIYFDIEGDRFFEEKGMEYLLGIATKADHRQLKYQAFWGADRKTEKKAFEQFIAFVMAQWAQYPDMYVYHFAPYEPSAIKRLAARFGTRENEVDMLLRGERFIDLHAIIKESLRTSVEQYSLKKLEAFTTYQREVPLPLASAARRRLESALELGVLPTLPQEDFQTVEDYNKDDCLATEALHRWVEGRYQEILQSGQALSRPELKTGEASDQVEGHQGEVEALFEQLTRDLSEDPLIWDDAQKAQWLLAHLVDYFGRERRSAWWEYFRLHELDEDGAMDERFAVGGLVFDRELPKPPRIKTPTHRYLFPPQEISIEKGDDLEEIMGDRIGWVAGISVEEGWIDIKKTGKSIHIHPALVHVKNIIQDRTLSSSLHKFVQGVLDYGIVGDGPFQAGRDLLLKGGPRIEGTETGPLIEPDESANQAAIRLASALVNSYLPIQGPPGSGKTYIGAEMILELSLLDKRIGVTAVSHKVIRNLLEKVLERAQDRFIPNIEIMEKVSVLSEDTPDGLEETKGNAEALDALDDGYIVGGTSWLWARDDAVETLDYLFVDEAGQMSLANVLAMARSARNIILLGDPQQLEQPQKGAHPEGADVAALDHVMDGRQTIAPEKGLFLDESWRLNPKICEYTSEIFYEGRLKAREGLEVQEIVGDSPFAGSGLFYIPVEHDGNQNKSLEEVREIKKILMHLGNTELTWTDRNAQAHPLAPSTF